MNRIGPIFLSPEKIRNPSLLTRTEVAKLNGCVTSPANLAVRRGLQSSLIHIQVYNIRYRFRTYNMHLMIKLLTCLVEYVKVLCCTGRFAIRKRKNDGYQAVKLKHKNWAIVGEPRLEMVANFFKEQTKFFSNRESNRNSQEFNSQLIHANHLDILVGSPCSPTRSLRCSGKRSKWLWRKWILIIIWQPCLLKLLRISSTISWYFCDLSFLRKLWSPYFLYLSF